MSITPTSNHVLVARIVSEKIGSIYLTARLQDDNNVGGYKVYRVLAVGPGRLTRKGVRVPVECEPGDRVICHSYTSGAVPLEGGRHLITDDQILAVLPGRGVGEECNPGSHP